MKKFFTSESVTEGHPDKLCDQIADAVLDEILLRDPDAHVACEVVTTKELVHIIIRWIFIELLKKSNQILFPEKSTVFYGMLQLCNYTLKTGR